MLTLRLDAAESLLFVGAHCDDIEIGCGGFLLEARNLLQHRRIHWLVFSSDARRRREAERAVTEFLPSNCELDLRVLDFPNGYFPSARRELKDCFEELKKQVRPDIIFSHTTHDLHQDHRVLAELCWNTFRNHLILEYEVLKYDGDLGNPNVFFPLAADTIRSKAEAIVRSYPSQSSKTWFSADAFEALARVRGVQCASETGFAEAFYSKKLMLSPISPASTGQAT